MADLSAGQRRLGGHRAPARRRCHGQYAPGDAMKGPPPVFPLRPTPAPGPFRRTPPMIFLAVIGLFALGLAWRKAALVFALPPGPVEAYLGAISLLWVMAAGAYLGKILRRPGVIRDELATMPGRVGLSSAVLSVYFMAVVLLRYAPGLAWTILLTGFALHVVLALLLIDVMRRGPPEGRGVTPAWQLSFTGFVVGALGASGLQLPTLAVGLVYAAMPVAATIWTISLIQLVRRVPPAPLRPLLALHLGPASLLTTVSVGQHHPLLAIVLRDTRRGDPAGTAGLGRMADCQRLQPVLGRLRLSAGGLCQCAADTGRAVARGGGGGSGCCDGGCADRLGPHPSGLGQGRSGAADERGDRLDPRDPGAGQREARCIRLDPPAGRKLRMGRCPAGLQPLGQIGEGARPVGDDGTARLEMELRAVGGAADAEGLLCRPVALSARCTAPAGRVKVSECHWKIGKAAGRAASTGSARPASVSRTSLPAEFRRGAQMVRRPVAPRQNLTAKADAQNGAVSLGEGRASARASAGR